MNNEPTIFITLKGATPLQVDRCRKIIHRMFTEDVFNIRRGEVLLNFDHRGELGAITIKQTVWRSQGDLPRLTKKVENVTII